MSKAPSFSQIAEAMTVVQNAPSGGFDAERVFKTLKHDVALIVRPISVPTQRRQREGVSGVVGEVETTLC
jgi:hypothetical protein